MKTVYSKFSEYFREKSLAKPAGKYNSKVDDKNNTMLSVLKNSVKDSTEKCYRPLNNQKTFDFLLF